MSKLAICHIKILLDLKNNHRLYTYENLAEKYEEQDVQDLHKYIRYALRDDNNRSVALAELSDLGKAEVDSYYKEIKAEEKEDKRWKDTRRIAWIGIGISAIATLIALIAIFT